ncbi:MAG: hypothetical protein ACYTGW_15005 [Planctomycetota bacterium]|jgi:hypothetical protein
MTSANHDFPRLAAALAGLALCLCQTGCYLASFTERASKESLLDPPAITNPSVSVAVEKFWANAVQRFDYESEISSDTIVTRWKQMPGQTDVTYDVVEALQDAGYTNVGATGAADAAYRIVGFLDRKDVTGVGWILYDSLVLFPALFLPVPFKGGDFDGRIGVSVYDRAGTKVASRTTYYHASEMGLSIWGAFQAAKGPERYAACAGVAAELIEELERSRR